MDVFILSCPSSLLLSLSSSLFMYHVPPTLPSFFLSSLPPTLFLTLLSLLLSLFSMEVRMLLCVNTSFFVPSFFLWPRRTSSSLLFCLFSSVSSFMCICPSPSLLSLSPCFLEWHPELSLSLSFLLVLLIVGRPRPSMQECVCVYVCVSV